MNKTNPGLKAIYEGLNDQYIELQIKLRMKNLKIDKSNDTEAVSLDPVNS